MIGLALFVLFGFAGLSDAVVLKAENSECLGQAITCPAVDGKDPVYIPVANCSRFCECSNGVPYLFDCPDGLHFNTVLNVCDWPQDAGCGDSGPTTVNPVTTVEPTTTPAGDECAGIDCPDVCLDESTITPLPNCSQVCECANGKLNLITCPSGLHYNVALKVCDWPENAGCEEGTTTVLPVTSTSAPTTSTPDDACLNSEITCPAIDGDLPVYIPLPDCTQFCECSNGKPYLFDCPDGLHFNPVLNVCDWPEDAGCDGNSTTTTTSAPANTTTSAPPTTTTRAPTTTAPVTTTKPNDACLETGVTCPAVDGELPVYIPLPDCTQFCECSNGKPYIFDCPDGLHFNPVLNVCDWPEDAGCDGNSTTTSSAPPTTTTSAPPSTTTRAPTTAAPVTTAKPNDACLETGVSCPAVDGELPVYIPLPDCTQFCECSNGKPYIFDCPDGLHFNPVLNVCDWPEDAGCDGNSTTTSSAPTTTTTTSAPSTTTRAPTTAAPVTTAKPNDACLETGVSCPAVDGELPVYIPLPDCTQFCECSNGKPYIFDCPDGLHFNPVLNVCDWPEDAGCDGNSTTTSSAPPTTTTSAPPSTTTRAPTTAAPVTTAKPNDACLETGASCPAVDGELPVYIPLPDCTQFCECSNGKPYIFDCPDGLHFNPVLNVCDWPEDAGCDGNSTTTSSAPTTTTTSAPSTTTRAPTTAAPVTTAKPNDACLETGVSCPAVDGELPVYIPLPDCTQFCECSNGKPYIFDCPDGLHFNPVLNVCDWPEDAGCDGNSTTTSSAPPTTTTSAPPSTTRAPTTAAPVTTAKPNDACLETGASCPAVDGELPVYIPLPDCTQFCECSNGKPYIFDCPDGLHFNPVLNVCDWPEDAGCDGNSTTTSSAPTTTTTSAPSTTTRAPTTAAPVTTAKPNDACLETGVSCPAVDGELPVYIPLPDCTQFCECSNGKPYIFDCPDGLHFNPVLNVCDWPEDAGCDGNSTTTSSAPPTTTTSAPPSTTTRAPTTAKPNDACLETGVSCPAVDGELPVYIPLPDCTQFCECSNGKPYIFDCPDGLHFNPVLNVCDWPEDAGCDGNSTTTSSVPPTTTTSAPPTTTRAPTTAAPVTTAKPNDACLETGVSCPAVDGDLPVYIPLPDCTQFCECSNGKPYIFDCPDGLHFNPVLNVCDWPEDAGCDGNSTTTSSAPPTTTTSAPPSTTTRAPTTAAPVTTAKPNDACLETGASCPAVDGELPVYIPLPDCTQFCECSNGKPYIFDCPDGLHFNPVLNVCDWPEDAGCDGNSTTTSSVPPTTTTSAPPTTTRAPTTAAPVTTTKPNDACLETGVSCPAVDGELPVYIPLPDCTQFCECSNGKPYIFDCPDGLHFNPVLNVCDWPEDAGCDGNSTTTSSVPPTTTTSAPPTTTRAPTTAAPVTTTKPNDACLETGVSCPAVDGELPVYIPLPDCTQFCECSNGKPYIFDCPDGLHFNPVLNVCDWPEDAGCDGNSTTTSSAPPTTTTSAPSTTTRAPTTAAPVTTTKPNDACLETGVSCPAVDGELPVYIPLPDCTQFCECSNGKPYIFDCPDGLHFNPVLNVCDWPEDAGCDGNSTTTSSAPPTTTTSAPPTTTRAPTTAAPVTTTKPNDACLETGVSCPAVDGELPVYIPLPDCTQFCECSNGKPYIFDCPDGLHFNPVLNVCDWPEDAGCNGNSTTTSSAPPTTTTSAPSTTTRAPTTAAPVTTTKPNDACLETGVSCPAVDGELPVYIPLPDCTQFCECSNGKPYIFDCPDGLHFNPVLNVCDWLEDAGCDGNSTTTSSAPPTTTTSAPPTTTRAPTTAAPVTTTKPNDACLETGVSCPAVDGELPVYIPLPDCTQFCECSNGKPYIFDCPDGLHFNPVLNVCDWPEDAGCDGNSTTTSSAPPTTTTSAPSTTTRAPTTAAPVTTVTPTTITRTTTTSAPQTTTSSAPPTTTTSAPTTTTVRTTVTTTRTTTTSAPPTTTTQPPTTTVPVTTAVPSTSSPNPNDVCRDRGKSCPAVDGPLSVYISLPDCTKFCQCSNGDPYVHDCPQGLHFNPILNVCDWPQDAGCTGV